MAATVHNEMTRWMAAKSGQRIKDSDLHNPEQYLPDCLRTKTRKKAKRRMIRATDKNAAEQLARRMGAI